jgi:hypothetical protein
MPKVGFILFARKEIASQFCGKFSVELGERTAV